ncbi:MAG: RNA methyltransferase [Desulfobulbaceae bacterium]|uniref:RNA methyltransferase n=1 Tax=Candidatus Desulfatifera sulfidica TaxID=2841691 RepID=A0A8J6NB63_9BACT|nr:RNA methyltransferase [Candidatus Desulfatifera sulfidica]
MSEQRPRIDIALVHHPVLNKNGETIGSAVTNLDLHDIARAARTFGVENYYVITPYTDQQEMVSEIVDHWQTGHGATRNPARKEALELVRISPSLGETIEIISQQRGERPLILTTSAKVQDNTLNYGSARDLIAAGRPVLLLFGTAHGLAPEISTLADHSLPPINGSTNYNHLSVRSAVSIILDRLLAVQN